MTSRCSSRDGYRIIDLNATEQHKKVNKIDWDLDQIERGGFAHFMLKEIFEQPTTIENAMRGRLLREEGTSKLGGLNITDEELLDVRQHRHHRVRHELALGAHRRAHDRGAHASSGRGRVRVGVPLPQSDRQRAHALHRDLAVRRDGRHARGNARGEASRSARR